MINDGLVMQSLLMGDEKNKVIYLDNFLKNPSALVEYATNAAFLPAPGYEQRKGYPGVRTPIPAIYGEGLVNSLGALVASEFNVPKTAVIKRGQENLCLMTLAEAELGPFQTVPHFDTSKPEFFAALLYLCGEEHGGTAFYKHLRTGYESIKPERSNRYLDACHIEFNSREVNRRYFSESDNYYKKVGFIPARFNRLVIYRGCLLHSANILSSTSINADPKTGRLTANIFLNFV